VWYLFKLSTSSKRKIIHMKASNSPDAGNRVALQNLVMISLSQSSNYLVILPYRSFPYSVVVVLVNTIIPQIYYLIHTVIPPPVVIKSHYHHYPLINLLHIYLSLTNLLNPQALMTKEKSLKFRVLILTNEMGCLSHILFKFLGRHSINNLID